MLDEHIKDFFHELIIPVGGMEHPVTIPWPKQYSKLSRATTIRRILLKLYVALPVMLQAPLFNEHPELEGQKMTYVRGSTGIYVEG